MGKRTQASVWAMSVVAACVVVGFGVLSFGLIREDASPVPIGIDGQVNRQENVLSEVAMDERMSVSGSEETDRSPDEGSAPDEAVRPGAVPPVVPFISQAPEAQWSDPVFQNGCEEASIIMVGAWLEGRESLGSPAEVSTRIRALSGMADELFGPDAYDTSADDTAVLLRNLAGTKGDVSVKHDATLDDIRSAVEEGGVVLAPMDGRLLANPHYTAPGPEHHMIVILGYDMETREFVVNDPGTRFGAGWRYGEERLYDAIRDYRTGHYLPDQEWEKTVIVVRKF